jgi:hypothetical protein
MVHRVSARSVRLTRQSRASSAGVAVGFDVGVVPKHEAAAGICGWQDWPLRRMADRTFPVEASVGSVP